MRYNLILAFIFSMSNGIFLQSNTQQYSHFITVAQDGTGNFTSIQKAIESCKSFPYQRITIYIKNGIYHEKVRVPAWNTNISMIGASKDSTIITYGDYFHKIDKGPNSTFYTATLMVQANDFQAKNLTIENSAGPVGQAIALDVEGDRCSFINCKLTGNQDVLYAAGENARQYFKNCIIEGTTDFIFGEATALFDSCSIICKANSFVTAASTPENSPYGFVFKNCTIKALRGIDKVYLGRPWRKFAKVVFINCNMGSFIQPRGWKDWNDSQKTAFYAEYHSTGKGGNHAERVKWSHQLTNKQVKRYSLNNIFRINETKWEPLQ